MNENFFCLQPYHIGEKLLACLFNKAPEIVKTKFKIEDFSEAVPEEKFVFNDKKVVIDYRHEIDIILKSGNKVSAVELKLGPNKITQENKKKTTELFIRYFKDKCYIENNILHGNMCCLLGRMWKNDESPREFYTYDNGNSTIEVEKKWYLIVRDNSVKDILLNSQSQYIKDGLKNCNILSLTEIIKGNELTFSECIMKCITPPKGSCYLSEWGL